ncbi:MAG: hypothetical protein K8S62_13755 [Candidatus Sabulitectum sp.]|nr:hypothetical protein [Candidatus Sabulitectum sp.]
MNLKELVGRADWCDVRDCLVSAYPDCDNNLEGFEMVFLNLSSLIPCKTDMRLFIEETEGIDDKSCVDIRGRDGTLNRDLPDFKYTGKPDHVEYADSEAIYGLDFVPWEKWLDMEIDTRSLKNYTESEILAHCIWEMTFYGFDQTHIREQKAELYRRVEELDNMTEEEKKKNLIPWEEVVKELMQSEE